MEQYYRDVYAVNNPKAAPSVRVPSSLAMVDTVPEYIASQRRGLLNEAIAAYGETVNNHVLIDIGCGWGALLHYGQSLGMKVIGFEFTRPNVEFGRNVLGLDIRQQQFAEAQLPENSVDIVIMSHSLEHVPDPIACIRNIQRVLKPGGVFCCVVPNFDSLAAEYLGEEWSWLERDWHYSHFTPSTLQKAIRKNGLELISCETRSGDFGELIPLNILHVLYPQLSDSELHEQLKHWEFIGKGEEIKLLARKMTHEPDKREIVMEEIRKLRTCRPENFDVHRPESHGDNILWIRPDSIGDNVLSAAMLPYIREHYSGSKITVFCQSHIAELYEASPFVDAIIPFDLLRAKHSESYRALVAYKLQSVAADIALCSIYSRDPLYELFAVKSGAIKLITLGGDLCNIEVEVRDQFNRYYTQIIPSEGDLKPEIERHKDFLEGLGIDSLRLHPLIWTNAEDDAFADAFFQANNLSPERSVALFAGAQSSKRVYSHYGEALASVCKEQRLTLIALGTEAEYSLNQNVIDTCGGDGVNLCGKLTLRQSATIIKRCRLAVGAETGTAHIACAVGTPNVILLGGGHFSRFMPYSRLTTIVFLPLDCYNCDWRCRFPTVHCVKDINPAIITEAVRTALATPSERIRAFCETGSHWRPHSGMPKWKDMSHLLCNYPSDIFQIADSYVPAATASAIPVTVTSGKTALDPSFPRITLVTPSLNQGKYIEKTIRSVLEQGYPNLEYFIIDGGSTDETVSIIQRYADRITWWVSEKDSGQADAINKGLARATGVIFNWLNSDDYLEPGALFKVAETYRKDPAAAAWVGAGNRLHDNGFLHYISYPNGLFRDHIINNSNGRCFYQPACFMNTRYLKQLGGLRQELHFALDYELYIRLTALAPFVGGEGVWCTALAQPEAKTVKDADALWREIIEVQREYGLVDAVRNLELRLATGTFKYVMPRGIREKLGVAGQCGQLPQGAPEIPFSWGHRNTICFWGDFSGQRVQATFAVLNELLSVLFQRFEGIALKIFGADGGNFGDLSKPPYFTYCGTTPDQESLRTAKLCIIANDGMEGADGVIGGCRQNGIPLVVAREVAEQHQIIEGMQGFSAADPFSFAFRSVLPLLDPGVWGNMSAHMLLSHCGQPGRMAEVGELGYGRPTSAAPQPRIHVFIYTWNKCAELEIALRSLATTAYGNFKLFVLNNGSSDGTEQLLNGLVPALFREYKIINLPVNVGAAAARNWLFADPENREAAYLAYFDDDIEVEPDWLTNLLETLEQHPRAGVVGAKIINATGPKVVQHSGGVLTQAEEWINNVVLFTNVPDQGQFDNISERDYVMGCANLYRRSAMDEVGMFDIQFSPTQFDDVDHHLRMRLKGWQVLFNGRVEVRHHRSSGGAANANHLANRFKLEKKYSVDDAAKIIAAGSSLDFVAKHPWVLDMKG